MSNLNKAKTVGDFLKSELTKLIWKFEPIFSYVLARYFCWASILVSVHASAVTYLSYLCLISKPWVFLLPFYR